MPKAKSDKTNKTKDKNEFLGGASLQWYSEDMYTNDITFPAGKLSSFVLSDTNDDEAISVSIDSLSQVVITAGAVQLRLRKATPTEKRKSDARYKLEVIRGLNDDSVVLLDNCGAIVPTDEGSDEAD